MPQNITFNLNVQTADAVDTRMYGDSSTRPLTAVAGLTRYETNDTFHVGSGSVWRDVPALDLSTPPTSTKNLQVDTNGAFVLGDAAGLTAQSGYETRPILRNNAVLRVTGTVDEYGQPTGALNVLDWVETELPPSARAPASNGDILMLTSDTAARFDKRATWQAFPTIEKSNLASSQQLPGSVGDPGFHLVVDTNSEASWQAMALPEPYAPDITFNGTVRLPPGVEFYDSRLDPITDLVRGYVAYDPFTASPAATIGTTAVASFQESHYLRPHQNYTNARTPSLTFNTDTLTYQERTWIPNPNDYSGTTNNGIGQVLSVVEGTGGATDPRYAWAAAPPTNIAPTVVSGNDWDLVWDAPGDRSGMAAYQGSLTLTYPSTLSTSGISLPTGGVEGQLLSKSGAGLAWASVIDLSAYALTTTVDAITTSISQIRQVPAIVGGAIPTMIPSVLTATADGAVWATLASVANALQSGGGGNTIPIVKTAFCAHYLPFDDGGDRFSDRVLGRWTVRDQTGILGITALQDQGRFVQPGDVGSSTTATVYSFNVQFSLQFNTNLEGNLEVRKYDATAQTYSTLIRVHEKPFQGATNDTRIAVVATGLVTLLPADYVDVRLYTGTNTAFGEMSVFWGPGHGSIAYEGLGGGYWTMVEV